MTDARRLQIFVDCPYGGCEDGYCACLEQDLDEDFNPEDFDEGEYDDCDPDELSDLFGYVPERTVRRYCPDCGQVVQAAEDDPDRVPFHRRYEGEDHVRCPASKTRQPLEVAP